MNTGDFKRKLTTVFIADVAGFSRLMGEDEAARVKTLEILKALDVKLTYGEGARILGKGTNNLDAYLKFLEARELTLQLSKESNFKARQLAEEVTALS